MPRKEASDLVLRARIALERLRNGEVDRSLINLVSRVIIMASFITRAGHGKLDSEDIERDLAAPDTFANDNHLQVARQSHRVPLALEKNRNLDRYALRVRAKARKRSQQAILQH
ncbi:hypothetical protein BH160DRAFT_0460 [Burkholderia sp. H160]|nr:hypothetical protein BH160DRAFT_0460 [Burkholderia sp. H160]